MPDDPVPDAGAPDDVPPADDWQERLALLAARRPVEPARLALAAALFVVVAVAATVVVRGPEPPPPELSMPVAGQEPAAPETTTTTLAPDIVVHAAGAVEAPGVYALVVGSRVADLVEAAGGASSGADLGRVNLAAALVDGQRVYLPLPGEVVPAVDGGAGSAPAGGGGGAGEAAPALVDLNRATAEELEELPGVGPATSAAIIAERDRRGRFAAVDDLLDVRGIGDAKLAAVRDLVVVS